MNKIHLSAILLFVVAYFIGAKWPALAKKTGLV